MAMLQEETVISRPDIEEIERLMLLRAFHRRERRTGEWVMVPDWARLAKEAGMSTTQVYRIRDREVDPRLGTLSKLATALCVLSRDIITDEPEQPRP